MSVCELPAQDALRPTRYSPIALLRRTAGIAAAALAALVAVALLVAYVVPITALAPRSLLFKLTALAYLVRTLALHAGLVLLVPLGVALVLRRWRLAAFVALVVAWCVGPALWDYRPRAAHAIQGESLRIMTCNLLRSNHHADAIAAEILAANPDVVCFQECARHWHTDLTERLGARYPYRAFVPRLYDMGLAIYAQRPFIGEVEKSDFRDDPPAQPLRVVIEVAGRQVALYNLHMFQPWPPATMACHLRQLAGVRARLARETLPTILAGDFNATPTSATLAAYAGMNLTDAWDIAGWGRGSTWPDVPLFRHLPGIRIDHVCLSPQLTCTRCAVGRGAGSDHHPVIADVGFSAARN
ncbi:MAG TPA: endonuclease/exonuclease/phosphatase family protein [Phycisphaerae bacterium]|nr:endonuclease/exonuclease/phosphatase family protein [Phycisphaerae bacterium]